MAIWTGWAGRIGSYCVWEETAPRDVWWTKDHTDGVLIHRIFPDAEEVSVIMERKTYVWWEKEDEAGGYFAVLLPVRKVPKYSGDFIKFGRDRDRMLRIPTSVFPHARSQSGREEKAFAQVFEAYKKLPSCGETKERKGTFCCSIRTQWVTSQVDFNGWTWTCDYASYAYVRVSWLFENWVEASIGHYKYEIKVKGMVVLLWPILMGKQCRPWSWGASAGRGKCFSVEWWDWRERVPKI